MPGWLRPACGGRVARSSGWALPLARVLPGGLRGRLSWASFTSGRDRPDARSSDRLCGEFVSRVRRADVGRTATDQKVLACRRNSPGLRRSPSLTACCGSVSGRCGWWVLDWPLSRLSSLYPASTHCHPASAHCPRCCSPPSPWHSPSCAPYHDRQPAPAPGGNVG